MTPFVEGRVAGGILGGKLDAPLAIAAAPGVTVNTGTAATWIYGGGIDAGVALYSVGRAYLSASIGWVRTTWHGIDYTAMSRDPLGGMKYKDLTGDSVTFKLGLGI